MAKTILSLVAFVVIGTLSLATTASADVVVVGQPTIVSSSSSSNVVSAETVSIDASTQGKLVLRWVSTKPKKTRGCKRVKSFRKAGNAKCIILPVGTPFNNSGIDAHGRKYTFRDRVKKGDQRFYRSNTRTNNWCKGSCRNCAGQVRTPRLKAKNVILVRSFSTMRFKVKVNVSATAMAAANATCVSNGSWATATSSGHGASSATFDIYVYARSETEARANARVSVKQRQHVQIEAEAKATASVSATAQASCGGTIYICPPGSEWNGVSCAKDGTTTPPPPPNAPGPNPPPSQDDPAPGPNMCYSTTTGAPVQPIVDPDGSKRCPAGSYGA